MTNFQITEYMLSRNIFFIITFLILFFTEVRITCTNMLYENNICIKNVTTCDPHLLCSEVEEGCKVYDPDDCHNYYICIKNVNDTIIPSDNPVSCSSGYYFNYDVQDCSVENTPCVKPCLNYQCEYACPLGSSERTYIADPRNCSLFYVCGFSEEPLLTYCYIETPYFNGYNCSSDPNSCCDGCIPYCKVSDTETLDPFDCKSYYLCEEVGVPSDNQHFQCPEGQYFDISLGACQDMTEDCSSLCSPVYTTSLTTFSLSSTTLSSSTEDTTIGYTTTNDDVNPLE